MKREELNRIFNREVQVPNVDAIQLDRWNIEGINPDVVTSENIWSVLVMTAMVTKNSGCQTLRKVDVHSRLSEGLSGRDVLTAVKRMVIEHSVKERTSVLDVIIGG